MALTYWHKARSQVFAIVCCFSVLAFLISKHATADTLPKPSIVWSVPAFAPAFINKGGKLSGYAADTQNWFAAKLQNYHHSLVYVPLPRLLAEMKNGQGTLRCTTTLIPTPERREYIVFAKTILLHLPISVVIRAEDEARFVPYLNAKGHLDLEKLLSDERMTTAVHIGRVYGRQVDTILNRFRTSHQMMQIAEDTKFVKMLDLKRIDWALYFPSEAEYYRRMETPELDIKALPIAGSTSLLEATIGCAKTPAGQQAIAEINAIIDANPTMPWTEFYAEWLSPNDREWFKAARDQYIHSEHFETRLEYRPSNTQ